MSDSKPKSSPTVKAAEDTARKPRPVSAAKPQTSGKTDEAPASVSKPAAPSKVENATAPKSTPAAKTVAKTAASQSNTKTVAAAPREAQTATRTPAKPAPATTSAEASMQTAPPTPRKATQTTPQAVSTPIRTTQLPARMPAGSLAPETGPAPQKQAQRPAPQSTRPAASAAPGPNTPLSERARPAANPWGSDALARAEDLAPDQQPLVMEERPGRRVNLDLQGADIRTVLRTLADYSGVNIIASKEVQGEVSARIKDAPWRHALESILKAHGFGSVEENGIIRVGELEKIRLEDLEEKAAERKRDELLPIMTEVVRLQFASAGELQYSLSEMNSGRGKIQVDTRTNALIVSDIQSRVDQITTMARELDGRTPQVEIVSKLVDVSADDAENLGITWTASNLMAGDLIGNAGVAVPNVNPAGAVRVGTVQSWGQLDFMLDALARQKRANIVSNPNITTVDNREAKILVGAKIPLIVADEAGNAITQLTTVGIQMRVTPHVNSDKTITLDLHPEVSELSQQATVQGGVIINTSEADTRVIVDDGETAVIGGLIRHIDSEIKTGIPVLQDIPGLGWMFRNTNKSSDKRELIIFVTPRLIASDVSLGGADTGEDMPDGESN